MGRRHRMCQVGAHALVTLLSFARIGAVGHWFHLMKSKICLRFTPCLDSIFKLFQVDITGMFRMTSPARYFKEGVGSSRPNWRWIMCFLERLKANTSCKAVAKRVSFS